jgi:cyclic pyranopterin phosphate synthase
MSQDKTFVDGMIDVSDKDVTKRTAVATAVIQMKEETLDLLIDGKCPKGDVFETAKIAGIMAAKSTPQLIPMCHPLALSKVKVTFETDRDNFRVLIRAEVVCLGKTGVEMEALTAASTASLTVYDMMKWADKSMVIEDIRLEFKSGGKSGTYQR